MRALAQMLWIAALLSPLAMAQLPYRQVEVSTELERLMASYGFSVSGIEQTVEHTGHVEGETLVEQTRTLLDDFDHVIVQTPEGGIERIIILGAKVPYTPPPPVIVQSDQGDAAENDGAQDQASAPIELATQRQGASHQVLLTLEGDRGQRLPQMLVVDTGADRVVLPASLIGPLSLAPDQLRNQQMQTANGAVTARIGTLKAIWLGEYRAEKVEVAFIEDAKLGGQALLGMSLLGRFRVLIDDEHDKLTLFEKR